MTKSVRTCAVISLTLAARFVASAASQTISFDPIPNQIFGTSTFQLAAKASSGLPVTFSSTTPGVCKTASGQVMLLGAGPCFIKATQPGNATYSAATPVTRSFTVNLAKPAGTLTVSASSPFASGAQSVVAGDFNGDGIPDLATESADNAVTVWLGDGKGGFAAAPGSPFGIESGTTLCAVGEFDEDGFQDLVACSASVGAVSVWRGDGSGKFTAASGSPYITGVPQVAAVVGDFNSDGVQDIALAIVSPFDPSANSLIILPGGTAGGFSSAPLPANVVPGSMQAGDFNQDGLQDLAIADRVHSTVTVLLGDGAGRFTSALGSPFAVGMQPTSIVVGDFNGDGKQDLATGNIGDSSVSVLLGNGLGGFGAASAVTPVTRPQALVAGDFNGDGVQDLAALSDTNTITVLIGNGTGGFAPIGGFPATPPGSFLVTGDFNLDGVPDLVELWSDGTNSSLVLLLGGLAPVTAALTTTSPLTIGVGQSVPLILAVSDNGAAYSSPTGTVTFSDGTTVLGTAGQSASPYLFKVSGLALGTHTLTATYGGDLRTQGSTSNAITIRVEQPQSITFTPLGNVPLGTAPFALSATASSGLSVAFTSNTPANCTVTGANVTIVASGGCSISATQAGDGTYAPAPPVTQTFTVYFTDVASTDYYYAAVNALAQHGITAGCGNNNFCPQQSVTRDQMAIFIVRAIYGSDNFTYSTTPVFTDVQPSTFGFKWIQALAALGVTAGCGPGLYCPTSVVARDQMAIFIERARLGLALAGSPPAFTYATTPVFADTPNTEFAFPWIQRLAQDNITGGCGPTNYCPGSPVIRGDMAIFIMRGAFNQFLPAGTPVITQISPSTLAPGTSGTFTITGANTSFVQGTTQLSSIPGVTTGTIMVTSATSLTVQLTAASNATPQPYSILAITGSEQAVLPNGLTLR